MNFKASDNATEDTSLSYLDVPYLGPCKLKEVKLEEINDTPNCYKAVFGELEGKDYSGKDVPSGTTHEHVEWAPNANDDDDSIQKKLDRIAYIAGRVAPKDAVKAVEGTDWESYVSAMIQLMKQHQHSQKQLFMKALGDVYKGNPKVKFPGYRAFLSNEEGQLSWTAKERASNEEYLEALKSPASGADNEGVVDNVDDASF